MQIFVHQHLSTSFVACTDLPLTVTLERHRNTDYFRRFSAADSTCFQKSIPTLGVSLIVFGRGWWFGWLVGWLVVESFWLVWRLWIWCWLLLLVVCLVCLCVCLFGWLVGWLFGCLVVWLFGCLVVWLFGCLVVWLVVWLFGCLVVWLVVWLVVCLVVWLVVVCLFVLRYMHCTHTTAHPMTLSSTLTAWLKSL